YADVRARATVEPEATVERFRSGRDELFATHPASPLTPEACKDFAGLPYASYDAGLRFEVEVDTSPEPLTLGIATSAEEPMRPTRQPSRQPGRGGRAQPLSLTATSSSRGS